MFGATSLQTWIWESPRPAGHTSGQPGQGARAWPRIRWWLETPLLGTREPRGWAHRQEHGLPASFYPEKIILRSSQMSLPSCDDALESVPWSLG